MSGARRHGAAAERIYACLLRTYPPEFRAEYAAELRSAFRDWNASHSGRGGIAILRFWAVVLLDLARSVPREWRDALAERRPAVARSRSPHRPPYAAAAAAGLAVLCLYIMTLAPTVAFWDAGEYITVAHILGIPHPPGNPLFVILARGWEMLLAPLGLPVAVRIHLLSAVLSAAAHACWFLLVHRALAAWSGSGVQRHTGAAAAVALSATAFTVWNQSNVNEKVYTLSFFTVALVGWLLVRWRDAGRRDGRLLLIAFLLALTATNHLMGVLVAPAALVFVLLVDRRALLRPRLWLAAGPLVALALSVQFFLPLRAAQRPLVSEGEPVCESVARAVASVYTWGRTGCEPLSAVLRREQYSKPSVLADPNDPRVPRGRYLVASQFINYLQYLDWQWARSVAGRDPLFGGTRPLFTAAFLLLGVLGARTHWRSDRASAALLGVLFLTLSAGLVLYLNFRYGYSIARERFPDAAMHEVRERDYFFLIGFSVWGLWAGIGLAALWRRTAVSLRGRVRRPGLAAAPVLSLVLVPLLLNWGWASRAEDFAARDWAYNVLMSVEPYGVLVTNGDNDSFPLWYLQMVEGVREDVTIVLSPYLETDWYVRQLRELTRPCPPGVDPADHPTRIVCQRSFDPGEIPAALAAAGWTRGVDAPEDSILPLSDAEIRKVTGRYFVAQAPVVLRAAGIEATIPAGTALLPSDTFAAVIVKNALGKRPVHFMPGSPHVRRLGLYDYTIRQGLTWKIREGTAAGGPDVVRLPEEAQGPMAGAALDLALTDTLLHEVYLRRGRLLQPEAPWTDAATANIPFQYVLAHHVAAQAHALRGADFEAQRHLTRAREWERIAAGS